MKKVFIAITFCLTAGIMFQCQRSQIFSSSKTSPSNKAVAKVGIKFQENKEWEAVLAEARNNNKIIFVDFFASWCGPCKYMDREVFTQESVANKYNKRFINVKVDGESFSGVNLGIQYEIGMYPTYLFVNSEGQVIRKMEGMKSPEQMIEEADNALGYALR